MAESDGEVAPTSIPDLHRAIGAVVVAATNLERQLGYAVTSLMRTPLASIIVQGERGTTLINMARRLLSRGVGSTEPEERAGTTARLGLVCADDTATFHEVLKRAESLLKKRDDVVHSLWLPGDEPGVIDGYRSTRAHQSVRSWTLVELEQLRQDLANVWVDLFNVSWNASDSGMPRTQPRQGDVG